MVSYDLLVYFPLKPNETIIFEQKEPVKNLLNPFNEGVFAIFSSLSLFGSICTTISFSVIWWIAFLLLCFWTGIWVSLFFVFRNSTINRFRPYYSDEIIKKYQEHYIITNQRILVREKEHGFLSINEEDAKEMGYTDGIEKDKPDKVSLNMKYVWGVQVFHMEVPYSLTKRSTKYSLIFYLVTYHEDDHYSKLYLEKKSILDEEITESFFENEIYAKIPAIFDKKDCEKIVDNLVPKTSRKISIEPDSVFFMIRNPTEIKLDIEG